MEASTVTFEEISVLWSKEKFNRISKGTINSYMAACKITEPLYKLKFVDIRKAHLRSVIDDCNKGYATLKNIKTLFNQMYSYALENDIASKDYSDFVDIGKNTTKTTRRPFSADEISILFDNVHRMDFIDTILIMIYSGMRIGELLEIRNANIDLENRTMVGGSKTEAGKNRIIPINKKNPTFL